MILELHRLVCEDTEEETERFDVLFKQIVAQAQAPFEFLQNESLRMSIPLIGESFENKLDFARNFLKKLL